MASALGNFQWRPVPPHEGIVEEEEHDIEEARPQSVETETARRRVSETSIVEGDDDSPAVEEDDDDIVVDDEDDLEAAPVMHVERMADRMTLRELEEERELARRRTSVCLLLGFFLLFRLWIEALQQADFGLLMLCLVGTSWCARYIRHNREREEELDRRIQNYSETGGEERPDLRMLSFQAQLALAIMESQRQMLQGGYGHPDGQNANTGVSEEARGQWDRFNFKTVEESAADGTKKGAYGSVAQQEEQHKLGDDDEEPTCTICLGEYENGEELVKLHCNHVYHDECITAWTQEHTKCPLCNLDLELVATTENSSLAHSSSQQDESSD
mmetsp:Transcript_478/g.777  ORF Transcript_478/g.777 Transcript_478/m.777 type:complete len:329 (+) Transcript_478:79-1065(+)|eukprot:CAMPEP_0119013568 /NCGR_PEP_ID=MMETSP1176-20130426/8519_1 /TAXON_ID=265551 /ORGANISM="Synedropsis recta cf, Strain CCMP1620" /LENGTH=328 /DNA_ID=CAMNT_0006966667 /DNA_START=73 /DNA_END=1059 /DNA_ORIENTATION=+